MDGKEGGEDRDEEEKGYRERKRGSEEDVEIEKKSEH
jgi:hypothetical protein